MYEHFRNNVLTGLTPYFTTEQITRIAAVLDKEAANYAISEKETALAIYQDETLKLAKLFLASKHLEGVSELTTNFYANRLKLFFENVNKRPQDICTNDIRMFLVTYQQRVHISDRTLDKFRQILNSFFAWCVDEEYLTKNPCKNIHEIKYEVEPRHALTRMELEKIRRNCSCKRDLAMVDVLYSTGCRVSELINMKFSDMDLENNSVKIIGKGKKHNTVYLNTNAQISLNEYLKERKGSSDYIFVSHRAPYGKLTSRSVQRVFTDLGKKLNIVLSPHIMRHTSATLALQSGMPIEQVQKMLGHSSVATTQIYAEISQDDLATSHKRYVI